MIQKFLHIIFYIPLLSVVFSIGPKSVYVIQNATLLSTSSTGIAENHYLNPANLKNQSIYMSFSNNNLIYDLKGQKFSFVSSLSNNNFLFSFESMKSTNIPIYGYSSSDESSEGYFDSYWYACEFGQNFSLNNFFKNTKDFSFGFKIRGSIYKLFTAKESDYSINLGFIKKINKQIDIGFVVNNLGMKNGRSLYNHNSTLDSFEEFGVGVSYLSPNNTFSILSDLYFRDDDLVHKLAVKTNFSMFNFSIGTTHIDSYKDFCYGLSINLNNWEIIYGYLVYGDDEQNTLGSPTSIQFSAKF